MKLEWITHSKKFALGCAYASLGILLTYGLVTRAFPHRAKFDPVINPVSPFPQTQGKVKVTTGLSQTKVVQGSDGLVYLQIDLEAPEGNSQAKQRKPTDFIVVLDRSGSMADAKKMDYAHRAIESLVNQLKPEDRFALVTFDDLAETPIELGQVTAENKEKVLSTLRSIDPRGSTNLGAGLQRGLDLINTAKYSGKAHRLLMVSDGLANVGITSTPELSKIAARAVSGEFTISTIGVGLDFNENLLASIADHGTGNYHFLENLSALDKVLAQEFYGASQIHASALKLNLQLDPSIEVVEASGYPIHKGAGTTSSIPGPLYNGQKKTFFVTLRLPTNQTFTKALGGGTLSYEVEGKTYTAKLFGEEIKVACLPQERSKEALSSIQPKVYQAAWTKNNFGRLLKDNAEHVGRRDEAGALGSIRAYKSKLAEAYSYAPAPEMKAQMEELDKMEGEVGGAFNAPDSDTSLKRLSKGYQYQGIQKQRKAN